MDIHGEVVPRSILAEGFAFEGNRVRLLGPQGIFKPGIMTEAPLSIATIPGGPYDDSVGTGGALKYRYRGTDPAHPDNRGLRRAMQDQLPLIWFWRLQPGQYLASFPVFIVADDPAKLSFDVQVDDALALDESPEAEPFVSEDRAEIRREYVTAVVRRRVHQQAFRARSSRRIEPTVRSVVSVIKSYSMPPTSPQMLKPLASPWSRMAFRFANFIMPRSIGTS